MDTISGRHVAGWAADENAPDAVVDVSIFINETKVAQLRCDRPRSDLKGTRKYGGGLHGFFHENPEPLPDGVETRVTVRLSESGVTLPNGDVLILNGNVSPFLGAYPDRDELILPVPAPLDPRRLFRLFQLYDHKLGIFQFLSRLAFHNNSPQQIFFSVFGRLPAALDAGTVWNPYYPRDHLYELLMSPEFQSDVIRLYLQAFPEKKRLIFIHVPKCAGTDLAAHLKVRFPTLDLPLADRSWTDTHAFFRHLGGLAKHIPFCDTLFVTGHTSLSDYMGNDLIRPSDAVVTIVRDPIEIAVSHLNYILTRMDDDFNNRKIGTDTGQWCRMLEIQLHDWPTLNQQELARRILQSSEIVRSNSMCQWLGGIDAESALRRLAMVPVEITDTKRYVGWLHERWGVNSETRANQSRSFVKISDLTGAERSHLIQTHAEDIKLFNTVENALDLHGKLSIKVPELLGALSF